jgi:hypothetical protein
LSGRSTVVEFGRLWRAAELSVFKRFSGGRVQARVRGYEEGCPRDRATYISAGAARAPGRTDHVQG